MARDEPAHAHEHQCGGKLIHWGLGYDVALAVAMAGRGRRLRNHLADLLEVRPGQRVLDVGCGTGTLALAVAERLGPGGEAIGVDASAEMVSRAARKSRRTHVNARFQVAAAQQLPFPDASFDAAASTLVLHHLPDSDRSAAILQMVRVIRPDGRLLIADVHPAGTPALARTFVRRFVALHALGGTDFGEVAQVLASARMVDVRVEPSPIPWLRCVSARAEAAA
jgi:ubiquinone/menaquinone biosynthesis C-methylase UbiE